MLENFRSFIFFSYRFLFLVIALALPFCAQAAKYNNPNHIYETRYFDALSTQGPLKMVEDQPGKLCYLAGVSGRFRGGAESVRIEQRDGYYFLQATGAPLVIGYALCVLNAKADTRNRTVYDVNPQTPGPKIMTPLKNSYCYLSHLQGEFYRPTDALLIDRFNANYRLRGRLQGHAVTGKAQCLARGDSQAEFFLWRNGMGPQQMKDTKQYICALVGVQGALDGTEDFVRIEAFNGYWYLHGNTSIPGNSLAGYAVCSPNV